MKRRASGLLLLGTAVWVVSLLLIGRYPWLGYVRAAAVRTERVPDPDFRRFVRRELRQRMLGAVVPQEVAS